MKIGAENKKALYFLVALGLIAAYTVYSAFFSGSSTPSPAPARSAAPVADSGPTPDVSRGTPKARPGLRSKNEEFNPPFRSKKKEEQIDPLKVDPTLRLDLLAKVQSVPQAGGERDLFQILKSPPVKASDIPKGPEPKVYAFVGPRQPPPPPPPPPRPEDMPPPPIPLKYYGFCLEHSNGKRTAYFLDTDEIIQATEGITLKGRYKVVKIGPNSVLMEDTQNKRQQTLALEQENIG